MKQLLLFPDARPLVERLGAAFFRSAPETPGVYLMQDEAGTVLYVGKARNLRKRLGSYRVANPDRMRRRHLRLLRKVACINFEECPDEASALAREAALLRHLQPRYNRAGVWPSTPHFIEWRLAAAGLELGVNHEPQPGWETRGPFGAGARHLRAALARLLWCAVNSRFRPRQLPGGWVRGLYRQTVLISAREASSQDLVEARTQLAVLFDGKREAFVSWVRDATQNYDHPVDLQLRDADLEVLEGFKLKQEF